MAAPGAFPLVRAFVAELRAAGLEPTLTYAREGGLEVGTPDTRPWVPISLPHRPDKPAKGQPSG